MFNTNTATQAPSKQAGNKPKQDFGPVPEGQHVGRIVRVIGYGVQDVSNQFNPDAAPTTVFQVTVELPHETIEVEDKDGNKIEKPRWCWSKDIPVKFFKDFDTGVTRAHEKSKLHEFMSALFGTQDWTPEKVAEKFPEIIGKDLSIFVAHSQSKKTGKVYDNIKQFLPTMKGMNVPELQNDTLYYDPYNHDQEAFDKIAGWQQERIKNRLDAEGEQPETQQQSKPEPAPVQDDEPDDWDLPF